MQVTFLKVGEIDTTAGTFDADVEIKSRWQEILATEAVSML